MIFTGSILVRSRSSNFGVLNFNSFFSNIPDTGRWEKLPSGGYIQGYFQTAVSIHDRIYIFGGKNIHNYNFNELFEYRLGTITVIHEKKQFSLTNDSI